MKFIDSLLRRLSMRNLLFIIVGVMVSLQVVNFILVTNLGHRISAGVDTLVQDGEELAHIAKFIEDVGIAAIDVRDALLVDTQEEAAKKIEHAEYEIQLAIEEIHIIEKLAANEEQLAMAQDLAHELEIYAGILRRAEKMILAGGEQKEQAKYVILEEGEAEFYKITEKLHKFEDKVLAHEHAARDKLYEIFQQEGIISKGMLALSIILGCIILLVAIALVRTVEGVVKVVRTAAEDTDLRFSLDEDGKTEIYRLSTCINVFNTAIRQTLGVAADTTTSVGAAANELAATSQQLSANISSQTQDIQNVKASMDESTTTMQDVDNRLRDVDNRITDISSQSQAAVSQISELKKQSDAIISFVNVIKDISEQTNLLALNAAIEAARAGDAGRGFAVVADEVRKLATQTNETTESIEQNMSGLAKFVDESVQNLNAIEASVKQIAEEMQSVAAASAEQTSTIESTNQSLDSLTRSLEENAAGVSQATEATNMLADEATKLENEISQFKVR